MRVPDFWAEARKLHRAEGRQITVRRLGWSETSEADAAQMAEQRAHEALRRILAGEKLERLEPKVAYNGAEGVPIREEVLARHGEDVITRNAYGAHCLNSPHTLFADIDFAPQRSLRWGIASFLVLTLLSALAAVIFRRAGLFVLLLLPAMLLAAPLRNWLQDGWTRLRGGPEGMARARIQRFLAGRPSWSLRLYRTPAGLRLLATHQTFEADSAEAQDFFTAVGTDPLYARMCRRQRCFRARLTAKPWRAGIAAHMRPRPGVWPVSPERRHLRAAWVARYEQAAAEFAACHYVETLGGGGVDPRVWVTVELHDHQSRALRNGLALA
ncbi:hypothetical protein HNP55_001385 [Paucibacter oligotrophus]|uniref:Uncharacterized protein n=1 Tax=Roseateles oligotrophus TaxID=1769250 RepID=A0A840L3T8_9BURK|nr:hypothetical protein [Roseateles oligotrophus]MBB4842870.1 hypothetical protein [Roseateles oligotrophus]